MYRFHLAALDFILVLVALLSIIIYAQISILVHARRSLCKLSQRQLETKNTGVRYHFAAAEMSVVSLAVCDFRHAY